MSKLKTGQEKSPQKCIGKAPTSISTLTSHRTTILVQLGVITCLRDRAEKICNEEHVRTEKQYLEGVLQVNGYPNGLVHKELYRQRQPQPAQGKAAQEGKLKMIFLPYLQQALEHIQQVCRRIGVRAIFKSHRTL